MHLHELCGAVCFTSEFPLQAFTPLFAYAVASRIQADPVPASEYLVQSESDFLYHIVAMSLAEVGENPLRLTHCMRCGYSLESAPSEGNCPECGIFYDQGTIVLRGMWSGNGGIATASRGIVIFLIGLQCIWFWQAWRVHWSGDHFNAILGSLIFVACLAAELSFRFSARRGAERGALLQCRFNQFGCLQCDVPEETLGFADYRRIWRAMILIAWPVLAIGWCLTHPRSWIVGGSIVVWLFLVANPLWRRRRALKLARCDPDAQVLMEAAREGGLQVVPAPWSTIAEIRVGQFRGKLIRTPPNRWYVLSFPIKSRPKREQAINCEVEATSEQIRQLQSRIAQWQAEAGRKG